MNPGLKGKMGFFCVDPSLKLAGVRVKGQRRCGEENKNKKRQMGPRRHFSVTYEQA